MSLSPADIPELSLDFEINFEVNLTDLIPGTKYDLKFLPYLEGKLGDFVIMTTITPLADVKLVVEEQNPKSILVSVRFFGRCDNITVTLIETGHSFFTVFDEMLLGKPKLYEFLGLYPNAMYRIKAQVKVGQYLSESEIEAPTKPSSATLLKMKMFQDLSVTMTVAFEGQATTFQYKVVDNVYHSVMKTFSKNFEAVEELYFEARFLGQNLIIRLEGLILGDEENFVIGMGIIDDYQFYQTEDGDNTEKGRPIVFQYELTGVVDGFQINLYPDFEVGSRLCLNDGDNNCVLEKVFGGKFVSVSVTPFCAESCDLSFPDTAIFGKSVNDTFETKPNLYRTADDERVRANETSKLVQIYFTGHIESWVFHMDFNLSGNSSNG